MAMKSEKIRKLVTMAMLAALSIVLVYVVHFPIFPAAPFLEYDPADIPILIGTFAYGPVAGIILTVVVSVIQGMTVSASSGFMGIAMHIFATSILVLVAGVTMSVLPYFFLYRILRPLLTGGGLTLEETLLNTGAMALCMVLYGLLYVEGLALSHRSAYHTLENLRFHLQSKLEKQPLGAIQEKGVGVWKKMFIDDIESMELLLAHALPEGANTNSSPSSRESA